MTNDITFRITHLRGNHLVWTEEEYDETGKLVGVSTKFRSYRKPTPELAAASEDFWRGRRLQRGLV